MDIAVSDLDEVTKAVLIGRLDTVNVNRCETTFIASLAPRGRPAIVDMGGVSFVASLGIRMLLSTARALNHQGVKFALFGANPLVADIFETTALSDIIPVVETEAEAIALVTG